AGAPLGAGGVCAAASEPTSSREKNIINERARDSRRPIRHSGMVSSAYVDREAREKSVDQNSSAAVVPPTGRSLLSLGGAGAAGAGVGDAADADAPLPWPS